MMRALWSRWVGCWKWFDSLSAPGIDPHEAMIQYQLMQIRKADEAKRGADNPLYPLYAQLDDGHSNTSA